MWEKKLETANHSHSPPHPYIPTQDLSALIDVGSETLFGWAYALLFSAGKAAEPCPPTTGPSRREDMNPTGLV